MDGAQTQLPQELLDAVRTMTDIGSEVFIFGGFPKNNLKDSLIEARRKWILACKFDQALRLWNPNPLFSTHRLNPNRSPLDIVRVVGGVADPRAAEEAWLEAVWLWPDEMAQERAAYDLGGFDGRGAMSKNVRDARNALTVLSRGPGTMTVIYKGRRLGIRKAIAEIRSAAKKRGKKSEVRHLMDHQRQLRAFKKLSPARRQEEIAKLRHAAHLDGPFPHPELWIRYVVLDNKQMAERESANKRFRDRIRRELGRLVPASKGKHEYDAIRVMLTASICERWAKQSKENRKEARQLTGTFSVFDAIFKLTHMVLAELGYGPTPSAMQTRRILKSSKPHA